MAAEQDDVLSLSDNNGDSDFSGFDETDIVKRADGVSSKRQNRSKPVSSKDRTNKKNKSEKASVSSKSQNKSTSGAGDTSASSAAITKNSNIPMGSQETSKDTSNNIHAKGKSVQNVSKGKKLVAKNKDSSVLSNLSENDISTLKNLLGISAPIADAMDESQYQYLFSDGLENLPPVHVEVENEPTSDTEVYFEGEQPGEIQYTARRMQASQPLADIGNQIQTAMFDAVPQESRNENSCSMDNEQDEAVWQLPRLKAPQRGDPISASLASLINTACTVQCETDDIVSRHKLPSNCDKLASPLVNPEIWNDMAKKAQTYDKFLRDIQTLLAIGMVPVIKLSEVLRDQISNNVEAKTLISDAITMFGQAQFNLSLRRRYMIRPHLKKKYSNLCSLNTPVTSFLFGDDVHKEIKKCDTSLSIAKDHYQNYGYYGNSYNQRFSRNMRGYGRGRGGPARGYYGNSYGNGYPRGRYQPYARQPTQMRYQQYQQYQGPRKSKKTATVTSAEETTA